MKIAIWNINRGRDPNEVWVINNEGNLLNYYRTEDRFIKLLERVDADIHVVDRDITQPTLFGNYKEITEFEYRGLPTYVKKIKNSVYNKLRLCQKQS